MEKQDDDVYLVAGNQKYYLIKDFCDYGMLALRNLKQNEIK